MHEEHEDITRDVIEEEHHDVKRGIPGPIKLIIGLFLALIIIMMIIPHYAIKIDKEPGKIKQINIDKNFSVQRIDSLDKVGLLTISPTVRDAALQITNSCTDTGDYDLCYAKSLFYYVRDYVRYIKDPVYEYIQSPEETLLGAGDCEDQAIALAMLMKSIGINARLVVIPGHAYTEISLEDVPKKYVNSDGWIALDPTCGYCGFGQVPDSSKGKRKGYLDI